MFKVLLFGAVYCLTLPPEVTPNCISGEKNTCNEASFIPRYDLIGQGFDITTMQRKNSFVIDIKKWKKHDNTCTLCQNPFMNGKLQKIPASVQSWKPIQNCKVKVSSSVYPSSEDLVSSLSSSISNNWMSDLGLGEGSLLLAGTKSELAKHVMKKSKEDKFSFISHDVACGYYNYRLLKHPSIHPDLIVEFNGLPQKYDENTKGRYYKLIEKFGTHFFREVTLGGRVRSVTSIKQCEVSMIGLSVDNIKTCLDVEASHNVHGKITADMQVKYEHCKQRENMFQNKRRFSYNFNDRKTEVIGGIHKNADILFSANDPKAYSNCLSSVPRSPDMISYSIKSLHELIPAEHLNYNNLRNAIKDYILQRGLLKNCTTPHKIGHLTNPNAQCTSNCRNKPGLDENCCPVKGLACITVTAIKGVSLYGDVGGQTDGFVEIEHNGQSLGKTPVIPDNNNPVWNWPFDLGIQHLTKFKFVVLKVWDEDVTTNELLGSCKISITVGKNIKTCQLHHGVLYYSVNVKCLPGLKGKHCDQNKPFTMDAQLEKVYVSRNARPIPGDMLVKMGVLLDETIPSFNQSDVLEAHGVQL